MSVCPSLRCNKRNILVIILATSVIIGVLWFLMPSFVQLPYVGIVGYCFMGLAALSIVLLRKIYKSKLKPNTCFLPATTTAANLEVDADILQCLSGLPTRFSFKDLECATKAFSTKLGRGGFGSVYAGILSDGTPVAVKRLEKEGHGQKEFCAEVAIISRTRHANLVCLKGFCVEASERLLVYEYMPRGSLDRWIFRSAEESQIVHIAEEAPLLFPSPDVPSFPLVVLTWHTRYHIALATARGLAYLHEECEESILHLDVKPQNILLDGNFSAKVSDFGLSRSMDKAQSKVITKTVRGTPGYLAPEWFLEGGISVKTDVYGYGMVLLELVSGRRCVDQSLDDIEHWFLPALAFRKVKENQGIDIVDTVLQGTLDEESCKQALRMIKVALWCIQEDGARRPSMSNVMQMLEGKMEVMEPLPSRNLVASRQWVANEPFTTVTMVDADTLTLR